MNDNACTKTDTLFQETHSSLTYPRGSLVRCLGKALSLFKLKSHLEDGLENRTSQE